MLYLAKKSPNKFFGIPHRLVSSLRGKSIIEIASYITDNFNGKPRYWLATKRQFYKLISLAVFLFFKARECLINKYLYNKLFHNEFVIIFFILFEYCSFLRNLLVMFFEKNACQITYICQIIQYNYMYM